MTLRETAHKKQIRWKKALLITAVILLLLAIGIAMIPLTRFLSTADGQAVVVEKMHDFGILAPLIFVALQVIQVVIAVIPGGPFPVIGGMLFGEVGALALCLAGFFLGTVLVYYLVQWIGRPLVDRFVPEKYLQRFDFLIEGRRLDLFVFLVFLLPGLPKDALTYLVSFQSKIKPMRFFILTTIGRTPATILTVFVGGSLWNGNYRLAIVLGAAMLLLAVLGIGVKKYIDRRAKRRAQAQKQAQEKEN